VMFLQHLLLPSAWLVLILVSCACSGAAGVYWTYANYAPAEAIRLVAHVWPVESSVAWCQQVLEWNSAFNEYCELRRTELKSGFPGHLTRHLAVGLGQNAAAVERLDPTCPVCGEGKMTKQVINDTHDCGNCNAVQLRHSVVLTCQTCHLGLCGKCVEQKGLLNHVATIVHMYKPYKVWNEQSTRSSLGSSAISRSITAVAACWSLHLVSLRFAGTPLLLIPAFCILQPLYDATVLFEAHRGNAEAVKQGNTSLSHLVGFGVGTIFYMAHTLFRPRSSLLCLPSAVKWIR